MSLTEREKAKLEDFDLAYRRGQLPPVQTVEQRVCGCAYGATSWATRGEADLVAAALGLAARVRLLDVGAGSGWPALYLAAKSGCDSTLVDVPLTGLRIAVERAVSDGLATRCRALAADGARLPFADATFDVISQSDVLCCLVHKREVLRECRRVIRPGGRMACSVIFVPSGLDAGDHARAAETAPEFVEAEAEYPMLFAATGWVIQERHDLTAAFAEGCRTKLRAEQELAGDLEPIVGADELERDGPRLRRRIGALERGHLKRELFFLGAAS
jgi:SAM-dependent methyltransferase